MNEKEITPGIGATGGTGDSTTPNEIVETGDTVVEETPQVNQEDTPKMLTQEEFNARMVERLKEQKLSLLKKFGIEDESKIDEFVDKATKYDELATQLETLKSTHASVVEKLAFVENNINPERYEDIRIYFKGKGVEFTPDNLKKELVTHKEWLNTQKPITVQVGAGKPKPQEENEKEKALKLFGL